MFFKQAGHSCRSALLDSGLEWICIDFQTEAQYNKKQRTSGEF